MLLINSSLGWFLGDELPGCLKSIGIRTWEEASKVWTVSCFCFTANTILLKLPCCHHFFAKSGIN